MAGLGVDVTEERQAVADLRASEGKFRAVVECLSEGVFLVDIATRDILEANPACLRLFGYPAHEFTRLKLYDLVTHDRPSVDAHCELVARHGCHKIGRRTYRRKDGALVDVELSSSVVRHGGRQVFAIVVRGLDEPG